MVHAGERADASLASSWNVTDNSHWLTAGGQTFAIGAKRINPNGCRMMPSKIGNCRTALEAASQPAAHPTRPAPTWGSGCTCDAGFSGTITATSSSPYYY